MKPNRIPKSSRKKSKIKEHKPLAITKNESLLPNKSENVINDILMQEFPDIDDGINNNDVKKENIRKYLGGISTYINQSISQAARREFVAPKTDEEKLYILDVANAALRKNSADLDEIELENIVKNSGIYMKYAFEALRPSAEFISEFKIDFELSDADFDFSNEYLEDLAGKFIEALTAYTAQFINSESTYCKKAQNPSSLSDSSFSKTILERSAIYANVLQMEKEKTQEKSSQENSTSRSAISSKGSVYSNPDQGRRVRFSNSISVIDDGKESPTTGLDEYIRTPSPEPLPIAVLNLSGVDHSKTRDREQS